MNQESFLKYCCLLGLFFIFNRVSAQEENILTPEEAPPGQNIAVNVNPKTSFTIGGALWLRSALQGWEERSSANRRGVYFDQFRLGVSGEHGFADQAKLKFSTQVRWWSYQFALHHMWIAVEINENHELRYGISQVPFGALPSVSSSFWFSLNYYHGLEGDHDAGGQYIFTKSGTQLHLGYFRNEEYNDPTATNRWAPDLIIDGDQQNFERHQGNIRLAHTFGEGTKNSTEIGISGQFGGILNEVNNGRGTRWASAIHLVGNYGNWNFNLQGTRYEFNPENPEGVDDRLVLMGFFSDRRLVAAKATTFVGNVRYYWNVDWWLFEKITTYIEYSHVFKDEKDFHDSRLFNPGVVLQAGPFYIWTDLMLAQNSWWFNDSFADSGPGPGSANPDDWQLRTNLSVQWYF